MNTLFLTVLTLFFAQGLWGRDHLSARMMAGVFVAGLVAAVLWSLRM